MSDKAVFDPPAECGDVMRGHKVRVIRKSPVSPDTHVVIESMEPGYYSGQLEVPNGWLKTKGE